MWSKGAVHLSNDLSEVSKPSNQVDAEESAGARSTLLFKRPASQGPCILNHVHSSSIRTALASWIVAAWQWSKAVLAGVLKGP